MNKVVSQLLCTMFLPCINILADFVPFQMGNLKFQLPLQQFSHFLHLIYSHTLVFLSFINLSRHSKRCRYLIVHKVLFLSPFIHCCCQEQYNGLTIVGGDFLSRMLHSQKMLGFSFLLFLFQLLNSMYRICLDKISAKNGAL